MKRIITLILCVVFAALLPCVVYADGTGNMSGGGGGMGSGTGSNFWNDGEDGVRVTVVRVSDNKPVSVPLDLTNKNEGNVEYHFGKTSKLQYRNGTALSLYNNNYIYKTPTQSLPKIIEDSGNANVAAIRSYFTDHGVLISIASLIGADYDTLISGKYKLLIEPVAYFTFNGTKMAMTATEAALYDQKLSGGLRAKMISLTHQNLPLSIFLEKPDLGYPAFSGSSNKAQSDATIISSLGLGVVKFKEDGTNPDPPTHTAAEYRVDTDVITSVTLNAGSAITPDSPASVTFHINGGTYTVTNIVIPEGESQIMWVKWRTPSTPQTVNITVSSSKGSLDIGSISAKIVSLNNNLPPDPTAKDRNDSFSTPTLPSKTQLTASSWGIWNAIWVPNWVWHENWTFLKYDFDS